MLSYTVIRHDERNHDIVWKGDIESHIMRLYTSDGVLSFYITGDEKELVRYYGEHGCTYRFIEGWT